MQRLLTGNEWILQLIHKIYKESGKRRGKGWGGVGGGGAHLSSPRRKRALSLYIETAAALMDMDGDAKGGDNTWRT
jgi:hypothetical protein